MTKEDVKISSKHLPAVAVGAVIFKNDMVLLVKRLNPPAAGQWAIPGGKVKPGESMHDALKRELAEETGLEIQVGEVVYVFDVIEYNKNGEIDFHYIIIDFLCSVNQYDLKPGDDALAAEWVDLKGLKEKKVNKRTLEMLYTKFNFS